MLYCYIHIDESDVCCFFLMQDLSFEDDHFRQSSSWEVGYLHTVVFYMVLSLFSQLIQVYSMCDVPRISR